MRCGNRPRSLRRLRIKALVIPRPSHGSRISQPRASCSSSLICFQTRRWPDFSAAGDQSPRFFAVRWLVSLLALKL